MTDQEKTLMQRNGITSEQKTVYHYKSHRYDRLVDAVNFAEVDQKRLAETAKRSAARNS